MNYLKIFEDGSTEATAELPTWGEISTTGDYHIDGLWYDKTGVLYTNQFTYLSNKGKLAGIEVVGGIPVDLHYDELAPDINIDCIVTNELSSFNGNRKIIELGTIFNNNRYVVDNPFGNEKYEDCDVRAEIFFNSMWSESNVWVDGTLARGVKGFSNQEGIAVQTGSQAVLQEQSSQSLNGFGSTGNTTPTSAPARVIVTYIGEAK